MNIIVTTTDSIEGANIERYIDVLKCGTVIDTDIALTDILSGANQKYSEQFDKVYDKALLEIKRKGISVGADAIVGLHTDFEDFYGKGKKKFIVSLVGTAVKLDNKPSFEQSLNNNIVPLSLLKKSQILSRLTKKLSDDKNSLTEDDWNDIVINSLFQLTPLLYRRYLLVSKETISKTTIEEKKILLDNFISFMQCIDYAQACEIVYSDITSAPYVTSNVIKMCNLFNPSRIVRMLDVDKKHFIISLLDSDKPEFTSEDVLEMEKIAAFLNNLPDTGHYETAHGKLRGKNRIILVCERGHSSSVELGGHCTETLELGKGICNLNVKGLTEAEVEKINDFKSKINLLKSLMNSD